MNIFSGMSVALIGYGVSNRAACSYLLERGISPVIRTPKRENVPNGAVNIFGNGYLNSYEDVVFRSPSVRPDTIKTDGIITTEIAFSLARTAGFKIGVTGSDGKTTVSTLIYELLKSEGKKTLLCGNIGTPLISQIRDADFNTYTVAELSSFQLMDASPFLDASVITNVTENHLDWHTDMDEYVSSKMNITKNASRVVLDYDNEILRAHIHKIPSSAHLVLVSFGERIDLKRENASCVCIKDSAITYNGEPVISVDKIRLVGKHNIKNYQLAIGAVFSLLSRESILSVAKAFKGVSHRCQLISEKNGVKFFDSSIDTTPSRTVSTLSAFYNPKTVLLLGGYDKNLDYSILKSAVSGIRAVITGANTKKIYEAIRDSGAEIYVEKSFFDAVKRAIEISKDGDSVLLSPASASFDEFSSYRERADKFREIIEEN